MSEKSKVTIVHNGKKHDFAVRTGLGFQALTMQQVTPIEFDCRKADCGICIMKVLKGMEHLSPPTTAEADFLRAMQADPTERLACQVRILGDVEVDVETF